MKKNEIALLILVASIAALGTYFVVNMMIGSRTSDPVTVEAIEPISAEIQQPSRSIFNGDAINPTVPINIGDNDDSPF